MEFVATLVYYSLNIKENEAGAMHLLKVHQRIFCAVLLFDKALSTLDCCNRSLLIAVNLRTLQCCSF